MKKKEWDITYFTQRNITVKASTEEEANILARKKRKPGETIAFVEKAIIERRYEK